MKKILTIGGFMVLFTLLAACGNSEEVQNPPQSTPGEGQQQTGDDQINASYGFTKFDLDADYIDSNDDLDVEYENERDDRMEASYRDRSQDINLNGDDAMQELDSIFTSFDFDENTSEQDVLNTITEAFQIPEDARVELEIEFNNGTEREYRK